MEGEGNDSEEYLKILKALMELPFNVGKNLLADFLMGEYKNKSISKNKLDELHHFGTTRMSKDEIFREIDSLTANGFIELVTSDYNRFIKLLRITIKGQNEITRPTREAKKLKNKIEVQETEITAEDEILFSQYEEFLESFNPEQKKAIVSPKEKILCIAGAGSGKTTVLTKRIEHLVKNKSVFPQKILAITFTRKARLEMQKRLSLLGIEDVQVHTFNSFCERILRENEMRIYGRKMGVQTYQDKIFAMNMALANLGLDMQNAIEGYFTPQQRRNKSGNQLANSFMNDCFSVIDYFKVTGTKPYDFSADAESSNRHNAKRIYSLTNFLQEHMSMQGLRDFTDQIVDGIKFLKENPTEIPQFDYILVDEYQDVNAMQVELIKLLNSPRIFAVGDPRQAIFGWRGSNINFILNFGKDFPNSEVIHLKKNYRSNKEIVEFMNHSIKDMGLPDLAHHQENENTKIKIMDFDNEDSEKNFILRAIKESEIPREEIFVLSRTNRQLNELSQIFKQNEIPHVLKTDEVRNPKDSSQGEITLATVHAIKGLEAKKVFVMGANELNFPCKATDHPAIEMVKNDDYDKEEEERRLFYVAISRAKEILYVTYSGKKPTYFINDEMLRIAGNNSFSSKMSEESSDEIMDHELLDELKAWRNALSAEKDVLPYTILHNRTLEEISRKLPSNPEELSKIDGIGPSKLINYGSRILEIVEEFSK